MFNCPSPCCQSLEGKCVPEDELKAALEKEEFWSSEQMMCGWQPVWRELHVVAVAYRKGKKERDELRKLIDNERGIERRESGAYAAALVCERCDEGEELVCADDSGEKRYHIDTPYQPLGICPALEIRRAFGLGSGRLPDFEPRFMCPSWSPGHTDPSQAYCVRCGRLPHQHENGADNE